jgi:hypothetical protein
VAWLPGLAPPKRQLKKPRSLGFTGKTEAARRVFWMGRS